MYYDNMSTTLAAIFLSVSNAWGLPGGLLSALCFVESNNNPKIIHNDDGGSASLGLCQIQVPTALFMGYRGQLSELMNPEVNINIAGAYLKYQLNRYKGDPIRAIGAYNSGTYKVRHKSTKPINEKYIKRVMRAWVDGK